MSASVATSAAARSPQADEALWRIVALALGAGLFAGSVEAQIFGPGATADSGGVAITGDVTGSTITIGLSNDELIRLVSGLTSPDPAVQAEALALLRARVPEGAAIQVEAVETLLRVLGESEVPEDQLVPRFEEIARRHVEMLDRLRALEPQDPETARLVEAARAAIAAGRFEEADALLLQAEDAELAAARQAQALVEQAQAAANARLTTAAATRAERGELARQQLDYSARRGISRKPPKSRRTRKRHGIIRSGAPWRSTTRVPSLATMPPSRSRSGCGARSCCRWRRASACRSTGP